MSRYCFTNDYSAYFFCPAIFWFKTCKNDNVLRSLSTFLRELGTRSQTVTLGMCPDILSVNVLIMFTLPFFWGGTRDWTGRASKWRVFSHQTFWFYLCTHAAWWLTYFVFFLIARRGWMWITCVWGAVCQHAREFPLLLWRQTGQEARAWPE